MQLSDHGVLKGFVMIKIRNAGGSADAYDEGETVEHALEAEVDCRIDREMSGADAGIDKDSQYGEADDEDEVGFFSDRMQPRIDQADDEEEEHFSEDDVGDIDEIIGEIDATGPVEDVIDEAKEGVGETDENGCHHRVIEDAKGLVRAVVHNC